jgi:hypothetical protein
VKRFAVLWDSAPRQRDSLVDREVELQTIGAATQWKACSVQLTEVVSRMALAAACKCPSAIEKALNSAGKTAKHVSVARQGFD